MVGLEAVLGSVLVLRLQKSGLRPSGELQTFPEPGPVDTPATQNLLRLWIHPRGLIETAGSLEP